MNTVHGEMEEMIESYVEISVVSRFPLSVPLSHIGMLVHTGLCWYTLRHVWDGGVAAYMDISTIYVLLA